MKCPLCEKEINEVEAYFESSQMYSLKDNSLDRKISDISELDFTAICCPECGEDIQKHLS